MAPARTRSRPGKSHSNEITAVPALLKLVKLKGTIVTANALNCQRSIARQIVEGDGDYGLALKGNQGTLHDDVGRYFDDPESETVTMKPAVDGDHGRIESRTARRHGRGHLAGRPRLARPQSRRQRRPSS